jgi:Cof subfamily protein (haloacid dehalogenase superfamily)
MAYRLLALDLDGTLLDPYGDLTHAVREAVGAARRAGLEVVLCTGRRFRTALPLLRELGLDGRAVVNNGAVVKDVASARTLHHAYLPRDLYPNVLALLREAGSPLVYVDAYHDDTDMLSQAGAPTHPFQTDYLADHAEHCRFVEELAAVSRDDVIMLSMMADEATLLPLRERAQRLLGDRVESHLIWNKNYQGRILELFSPASGKWRALARVAAEIGVPAEEIAAVGDDTNDAALLRNAGLGIAMGNAVDEVKAAADLVVRSNAEGGAVEAIHRVLLER